MERPETHQESELEPDPDLVELEALEREIAALEGELATVDGSAPEPRD